MLIAIMGGTYGERALVAQQIQVRDHLAYVIDNWYLLDKVFEDKSVVKYIITAMDASNLEQVDENLIKEAQRKRYFQQYQKSEFSSLHSEMARSRERDAFMQEQLKAQNQEITMLRQELNELKKKLK